MNEPDSLPEDESQEAQESPDMSEDRHRRSGDGGVPIKVVMGILAVTMALAGTGIGAWQVSAHRATVRETTGEDGVIEARMTTMERRADRTDKRLEALLDEMSDQTAEVRGLTTEIKATREEKAAERRGKAR